MNSSLPPLHRPVIRRIAVAFVADVSAEQIIVICNAEGTSTREEVRARFSYR